MERTGRKDEIYLLFSFSFSPCKAPTDSDAPHFSPSVMAGQANHFGKVILVIFDSCFFLLPARVSFLFGLSQIVQ